MFSVELSRDPVSRSFGFSVCDGPPPTAQQQQQYGGSGEQGIFINSIVRGSPAG
jgi:hypothetical protein